MGQKTWCPRCQHTKSWSVRRGKRRCAACRYEWVPRAFPLRLSGSEWRRLLRWFVLGHSAEVIAQEARLHQQRVLRALLLVRQAMVRDIPPLFSGMVEVDETYVGGRWRNKRRLAAKGGIRRERLPLYLAEYVWRYNHRRLSGPEQVKTLLKLLQS